MKYMTENPRSGTPTLHEISPEICEKFSKETKLAILIIFFI